MREVHAISLEAAFEALTDRVRSVSHGPERTLWRAVRDDIEDALSFEARVSGQVGPLPAAAVACLAQEGAVEDLLVLAPQGMGGLPTFYLNWSLR